MKHVLSTHLFVNHRLTTVWLDRIWDAGVPAVEIFCARQHLDWRDHGQIAELGHWFRDSELKLHSLHSPMYTDEVWGRSGPHAVIHITEPVKAKRIAMVDEIKRALEIAETDSVSLSDPAPRRRRRGVRRAQSRCRVHARSKSSRSSRGSAASKSCSRTFRTASRAPSGSNMFLDMTHLDLNFCFDIGHAHIMARRRERVSAP